MKIKITRRCFIKGAATAAALPALGAPAIGQAWPTKQIRIVCGQVPGTMQDTFSRHIADYLKEKLGQTVIVENKSGANGALAAVEVKRAPADGHTLLMSAASPLIMPKKMFKDPPFDTAKDFELLSLIPIGPLTLSASMKTGATNLTEFIAYARKNKVSVGCLGPGSFPHIMVAEMNRLYGIDIQPIQYRGDLAQIPDLASGQLDATFGTYNTARTIEGLHGRVIAVTNKRRLSKLPHVGTFAEQGATSKVFDLRPYTCMVGPKGITEPTLDRLSDLFVEAAASEKMVKTFDTFNIEDATVLGRRDFQKLYDEETPIWHRVADQIGFEPQ
ncbi:tripartite tricarboxylate transporter substrate binding protein [Bradyrhizobium sp. 200]|uniref:Bug family tripartite tricarboxylate transporter substrate binding protein n=1 Tax=Bradyrhizobium sp. 200 TaxID=2782665 RepID=UPI001FFE3741|nr:tripartite tricarboxylate transporter substrate binding protein [Bradyrhizobium sp. 200]UPJ49023.1 tripartite tricarboxylate transporter substrate binding protein [Bradyrhizobium sp. 200]